MNTDTIAKLLRELYGDSRQKDLMARVQDLIEHHQSRSEASPPSRLTERDAILIAYGDQVWDGEEAPLATLDRLLSERLEGLITGVHVLPFFPFSSDDGFSVIDYRQVDPNKGSWIEIERIAEKFRLMVDAVINHISAKSEWAEAFRRNDPEHRDTFIVVDPEADLSDVVRPRDLPLLTPVDTADGIKHLWTTFSADQYDLNFSHPDVMMEILDLLLFYVRRGAQMIRLDAIAYLWKQIGTTSIHLPETHSAVRLMRAVLDAAAPGTLLITETNVPHEENISYFGEDADEANLVYQFALPPLVLHTLISGNSSRISEWAQDIRTPFPDVTYLNFLASHDGIGLRPASEILNEEEMAALATAATREGGDVSYRALSDGGRSPYELNITYLDALTDTQESPSRAVDRFLTAHAMMLSMPGLPIIYFHSLFGSRNDLVGVRRTGRARTINRQKLELQELLEGVGDPESERHQVFNGIANLLLARSSNSAFSPWQDFKVLDQGAGVFGIERSSHSGDRVLCFHEVSGSATVIPSAVGSGLATDLVTGENLGAGEIHLAPYQSRWISIKSS